MGANYAYHADGTYKSRRRLAKECKISIPITAALHCLDYIICLPN